MYTDAVDGAAAAVENTNTKLASAAKAFVGSSSRTAAAGSQPAVVKTNVEKLRNAKDKVKLASLVARTTNTWSNKPAAPTSQACQIL